MKLRLSRALTVLAVGSAAFSFGTAANASTVTFDSTVAFTGDPGKVTLTSSGLNATLTVGTPDVISNFITVTVGTGTWSATNDPITATFTFTVPTPSGSTTDSGTLTGGQVNGSNPDGTLSITWPSQPVEFDFANGTKLDVTIAGLTESCTGGQNCLANGGPYDMSATFDVLNGPVTATPLPATLPLFAGGLGFVGYLTRRKRSTKRTPAAA
jgi:hypothetical protein